MVRQAVSYRELESIQWTARSSGADGTDVRLDHSGAYIGVSKQLLNGTDVFAVFEQVCGEAVAQRVSGC